MNSNPFLGVFFHWLGGLASASFYIPFRGVKKWSWETYWLVGGVFSWIIAPWVLALIMAGSALFLILGEAFHRNLTTCFWTYFFGVLWGFGGLTFGLTMRYLGISLGMGVALGYCAFFGTIVPPVFRGEFMSQVLGTLSGRVVLGGVFVCVLGIALACLAGVSKERQMSDEEKKKTIKEFNFKKGILVATFSGIMSSCFAYGLAAGDPIKELALKNEVSTLWQGLPVLIVLLAGGFTTNFIWCLILHFKNKTGYQYLKADSEADDVEKKSPLIRNYIFSALAGVTWYFQFFFYTMGETQMGKYGFSSWTLHMASIILFSSLWGIGFHEWKGTSRHTQWLLAAGLFTLVASTVVVGYGNYLATGK